MWLRLLIPFTLIWPVLAIVAEGTGLRRYRGTPIRELAALALTLIAYHLLWIGLHALAERVLAAGAPALVAATALALLAVPPLLLAAYRTFGMRPDPRGREPGPAH